LTKTIFASSIFLLLMFWKKGGIDYDSPEYRAIEAGKEIIRKISGRWRVPLCLLDALDRLQDMGVVTPTRPRFAVDDWYRQHLGKFLCVNKDGVLCHVEHDATLCPMSKNDGQGTPLSMPGEPPEMGGDTESDACGGPGSYAVPMESLVYNDLMEEIGGAGILWPNPPPGPNPGQNTGRTSNAVEGGWGDAFYENFLSQISNLPG